MMAEIRARTTEENKTEFLEKMKVLGFQNQEDFIMAAIRTLYDIHYVNNETEVLPVAIKKSIEVSVKKQLDTFASRIAGNMSNINVQQQIMMQMMEEEFMIPQEKVNELRVQVLETRNEKKPFQFKQERG
jgi:hypothetical protein